MPKTQKKTSSRTKESNVATKKKVTKKAVVVTKTSKKKARSNNNTKKKAVAPKLVNKRKEPKAITPKRNAPSKKPADIPNATLALLAVLTLIFMIWSAAVFFAHVNYPSSTAPTMERADNLASGAHLGLTIVPEPKSTATVGLIIGEEQNSYTYENNS